MPTRTSVLGAVLMLTAVGCQPSIDLAAEVLESPDLDFDPLAHRREETGGRDDGGATLVWIRCCCSRLRRSTVRSAKKAMINSARPTAMLATTHAGAGMTPRASDVGGRPGLQPGVRRRGAPTARCPRSPGARCGGAP